MTSDDFLRKNLANGGMATKGTVKDGFAIRPFLGSNKAHYWNIVSEEPFGTSVISACGIDSFYTTKVPLLGVGSYPYCKKCERVFLSNMKAIEVQS